MKNTLELLIALLFCLSVSANATEKNAEFDFNGYKYPVLYDGEVIRYSENISSMSFFAPQFGAERKVVNPEKPRTEGKGLIRFEHPGEYYIKINGEVALKVLVLSKKETFSSSVTRLFDFVSANMFFSNVPRESKSCAINKEKYVADWFRSEEPARLLCGPTHGFFRTIIRDRLKLPTRIVTFPGAYRWNGRIYKSSHNITEVYIPDLNKWVLFDINYGFFVKWMDALELAEFFHRNSSGDSGLTIVEKMAKLDVHSEGPMLYWTSNNLAPVNKEFSKKDVSKIPTIYLWRDAFRFYFSGAAYWGGELDWVKPTGTEFLPGEYLLANLHEDIELKEAAVTWIKSFSIDPTIVTPASLNKMLNEGHAREIALEEWNKGLPGK